MSTNSNKTYSSSPNHSFDIKLATELGSVDLAILIGHFSYWIDFNQRAGKNLHDERYWMYQTLQDLLNHFPYWSERHLRHLIATLVKKDILIRGNYNKSKMDKTCWYSLSSKEKITKDKNVTSTDKNVTWKDKNVRPIPDTKTDAKETTTPTPKKAVAVFPFLQGIGLSDSQISTLMKLDYEYPELERRLEHAVKYACHPQIQIKKSLMATIRWASKEMPETDESLEKFVSRNFSDGKIYFGYTCDRNKSGICFYSSGQAEPFGINFSDKYAKNKLIKWIEGREKLSQRST
jgi:hypothetical protein